jgi:SAM-dependent methyltransferase
VLLTLTTTRPPATDLGYLLHKHPDRVQSVEVSAGTAHIAYPEATEQRCTAALILEVDPIGLVRSARGPAGGSTLGEYVNDRPYAASSLLAVALGRVFSTALAGRCAARPELVAEPLPLELHVPALPCHGGGELAGRLFAPLGWTVRAVPVPLDPAFPEWGDSRYLDLRLSGALRLADALRQLYVLLPVLDDAKHYWVTSDEVDKLVRAGAGWLRDHPERGLIVRRYLAHRSALAHSALARLAEVDDTEAERLDDAVPPDTAEDDAASPVTPPTDPVPPDPVPAQPLPPGPVSGESGYGSVPLAAQRAAAVLAELRAAGASSVLDLGCGSGVLLTGLLADPAFTAVVGVDVSHRALRQAGRRLRLDRVPAAVAGRVRLLQSSLTYRDDRLAGHDAAVLMEVIEHVDPPRLPSVERSVFGFARPGTVLVTTPNAEHNVRYPGLSDGGLRHPDHRFEWTRAEFAGWASTVAGRYGYRVRLAAVGADDPDVGAPTQLAVFTRELS